jgi:flagellar biosynthesis protein FlhF
MADAMARVRAELGADALILASRQVGDGVEVTAALEPADDPPAPIALGSTLAILRFHGTPEPLLTALAAGALARTLATSLTFAPLPLDPGAAPLLLIGMPGAGKTLTVARLAARLVMAGTTPLVITADGHRAGATEQLAAFTRLLDLPLVVANHPVTLGRAVARRQADAPVLIDAPGLSPFDAPQRDELQGLAATTGATMVLVLPAGLDPAEAADLAHGYAALGATLMIPTRLDLARRLDELASRLLAAVPDTRA